MTASFLTVEGRGQTQFTVQGSEFIGHCTPAETVDAAESFIESIRQTYDDATHNVPAYRVRTGDHGELLREYQSDDGEPSGSAGKPSLNVLQGEELQNVAVVVTRYYGGTNLGVGGLVSAYGQATKDAVEAAEICETEPTDLFAVTVAYDDSGTLRGVLESADVEFDARYEEQVSFEIRVPSSAAAELRERINNATSGRATFQ